MNWTVVISIITCFVLGLGCQSPQKEAPLASVVIPGNTPGQVRAMAEEVFREKGYQVTQTGPSSLICEKKAGKFGNIAYGSWLDDEPVWVRVKVTATPEPEMNCRLQCTARLVADRGGPTEEEIKSRTLRHAPYQELLEEVARRFQSGPEPQSK